MFYVGVSPNNNGIRYDMKQVHEEMASVMAKVIPPGKGKWGAKPVKMMYCFEKKESPRTETEYLNVVYRYNDCDYVTLAVHVVTHICFAVLLIDA